MNQDRQNLTWHAVELRKAYLEGWLDGRLHRKLVGVGMVGKAQAELAELTQLKDEKPSEGSEQ